MRALVLDWARCHGAIRQSGVFNRNLGQIAFCINEDVADLEDKSGTMTACFRYQD
ncbi:hypothetical protein [Antarctobacter sp.]|uniref:hypothetical protein n=1 Tax=Antarctobacter sp. TaxID=1872577 RepID=UPI002B26FD24|nr:hypothetical protein [Antarctobacter sp.]